MPFLPVIPMTRQHTPQAPVGGGGGPLFGPDPFDNLDAWTERNSTEAANIVDGAYGFPAGSGIRNATIWNGTALPDAGTKWYAQMEVPFAANNAGYTKLAVMYNSDTLEEIEGTGTPHGYLVYFDNPSGKLRLRRRAGGSPATIFEPDATIANGDVLRVEVTDNGANVSFELFQNGVSLGTHTDNDPPSSRGQIWGVNVSGVNSGTTPVRTKAPEMGNV